MPTSYENPMENIFRGTEAPDNDLATMHARNINYIMSALQDHPHPTRCGASLSFALGITTVQFATLPIEYSSKRDSLRATLFRFFTAKRTDEEIRTTIEQFKSCASGCRRLSDKTGFIPPCSRLKIGNEYNTKRFLEAAFAELYFALNKADPGLLSKGKNKAWPTRMDDILSRGSDSVARSLLQWYRGFPNRMVLRVALLVLEKCGKRVHDSYEKFNIFNNLFINPVRELIDTTLARTPGSKIELGRIDDDLVHFFESLTGYLCAVPDPLEQKTLPPPPITLKGSETKAVQICSLILYIMDTIYVDGPSRDLGESKLDYVKDQARMMGQMVFRQYQIDQLPGPSMPLHPSIIAEDSTVVARKEKTGSRQALAVAIYNARFGSVCAAPSCSSQVNVGTQLRTCSGCSTVRYCSEECQKRDWKEGTYKHKRVCKALAKVLQEHGPWRLPPTTSEADSGPSTSSATQPLDEVHEKHREEVVVRFMCAIYQVIALRKFDDDESESLRKWAAEQNELHDTDVRIPVECHPGYDDYEELLEKLTDPAGFNGPEPEFMDSFE